ncbi:hypothetical protein [Mycolicibacterium sediminis]|uniref:Uncharacterized protein n=1 Tax=Mycolicibacterium sediminis TaxID=1286180 RepID=A0A7I7QPR3_9MYCO|nr:hypothetical protein [Mycolicibacterium sediminis]BBY28070.1 hypothetical protein MSEDJ_21660 [Mycolicibacterium sediminis]
MVAPDEGSPPTRYGPASVVAVLVTSLVLGVLSWALVPWIYLSIVLIPPVLVVVIAAAFLLAGGRRQQQVGRGMLIGCLTVPATLIVCLPLLFLL